MREASFILIALSLCMGFVAWAISADEKKPKVEILCLNAIQWVLTKKGHIMPLINRGGLPEDCTEEMKEYLR